MHNFIFLHDLSLNHDTPEACNLHIIKVGFKETKHEMKQNNAQLIASCMSIDPTYFYLCKDNDTQIK